MSPAEVLHRLRESVNRHAGRGLGGWERFAPPPGALPAFPLESDRGLALSRALGMGWREQSQIAKTGNWRLLGQSWPSGSRLASGLWHLDPVTGRQWPSATYCFDIPVRWSGDLGDVKYVWELNRLQFLPQIAALARYFGDEAARQWCLDCLSSWIEANPPFLGVNWVSGIELAIRATNILLTISMLGADTFAPDLAGRMRAALNAHAFWIARYPSHYSSANNHLVAEAAALFMLGALMPDLPDADVYRTYGFEKLVSESEAQFHPDGVGAEQSPTYSAFSLEWYLLALTVGKARGQPFPGAAIARLGKAGLFLRWITDSAGQQPRIGDDDEGVVVASSPGKRDYVSAVLSNTAAVVDDGAIAPPASQAHFRDLFVKSRSETQAAPSGTRIFDDGGYTVFRRRLQKRDTMLVFDHGPLGHLSIAAHGHADALAVWLHVDGLPVFCDAGTYLYHSGGALRSYFRGTRAHNTLEIDGVDQSTIAGPFNWSRKAIVHRCAVGGEVGDVGVCAEHNGYERSFGVVHRRGVAPFERGYTIHDRLFGKAVKKDMLATVRFLVAADLDLRDVGAGRVEIGHEGNPLIAMDAHFEGDGEPVVFMMERAAISPEFGKTQSTQSILFRCSVESLIERSLVTRIEVLP
jgi:hypothetical protein